MRAYKCAPFLRIVEDVVRLADLLKVVLRLLAVVGILIRVPETGSRCRGLTAVRVSMSGEITDRVGFGTTDGAFGMARVSVFEKGKVREIGRERPF